MEPHTPHQQVFPAPVRAIRAFVWDLADEGLHDVLTRFRDLEIDGLHLALAYHGGRFFCPHNPRRTMVHAPDGVVYFQPLLTCYEGLMPRTHPEYGSGAFVAKARDSAHELGISFTAWIVLFNNMTLASQYPECACVNAAGDRLEGTLCPSNPMVRLYAQCMVEDLAVRVGADVIELEDFTFPNINVFVGPTWRNFPIGPNLGYLLSLCFCEHCRRRAEEQNIEIDDLVFHIERMIRRGLAGDLSDRRIGDEISDPYHPVSRYAGVRSETITTLLDDLGDAVNGSPAILQLILGEEPDECWRWGLELHTLRQRAIHATISTARTKTAAQAFLARYMELLQLGRHVAADISLVTPSPPESTTVQATIEACEQTGIERFIYSNYGLAQLEMLDMLPRLSRG